MRTRNVFLMTLLLVGTTTFAQPGMKQPACGEGPQPPQDGKCLVEALNLTADQKAKLEQIHRDFDQKDSVIVADFRQKAELLRLDRMQQFQSMLTKDQLEKFETLQTLRADRALFGKEKFQGKKPGQRRGKPYMQGPSKQKHGQDGCPMYRKTCCPMKQTQQPCPMGQQGQMEALKAPKQPQDFETKLANGQRLKPFKAGYMAGRVSALSPEIRAIRQTEFLTKSLQLKPDQATKVQTIFLNYAKKDTVAGDPKSKIQRNNLKAMHQEIQSVLTKDQRKKMQNLVDQMKADHSGKD